MSAAALGNGKQSRRRNGEGLHRGKVQQVGNLDLFPVSKGEGSATWSTCFPCRASPKSQPLLLIAPRAATVMLSTVVPDRQQYFGAQVHAPKSLHPSPSSLLDIPLQKYQSDICAIKIAKISITIPLTSF